MKKVLLVDDNPLVGKLTSQYLSQHGFEVAVSQGPFGVLNKVREFCPDVILMDLNMPGLSGMKMVELLKAVRSHRGFQVILFSSEDVEMQTALIDKGLAQGYFFKGQSLEGLSEKINETASVMAA